MTDALTLIQRFSEQTGLAEVQWNGSSEESRKIRAAFGKMPMREAIELLAELIVIATDPKREEEAAQLFGSDYARHAFRKDGRTPLLLVVTDEKIQGWYDIPIFRDLAHGRLFDVTGPASIVEQFAAAIRARDILFDLGGGAIYGVSSPRCQNCSQPKEWRAGHYEGHGSCTT